ncbi:MAG: hypothetical protein ACLTDR_07420 [Adlercreutzia equolifaciens]
MVSVYALVLVGPEMDPNLGILRWLFAALVVGLLASLVVGKTSGDDLKAFLARSRRQSRSWRTSGLFHVPRARERHRGPIPVAGHHLGQRRIVGSRRSPG